MEDNYKLAKWLDNEMTDSELKQFQLEEDYELFEKIKLYSSELVSPEYNEEKVLKTIFLTKKKTTKVISIKSKWFFRVAAVLAITFGLGLVIANNYNEKYSASNGLIQPIKLPDNSEVVVNKESTIEFKPFFWKNNRKIKLEGEAYFKVAKGKKFEVNTSLGKVSVLGTQFNVKSRKNRFDVTCYEGKVKVNYNHQEVILTKGRTVSFENNLKINQATINDQKPSWTANEISFEKEKLRDVIEEIERQYNITIETSTINSNQLFTGKIPSNNIDIALQTLTSIYHLKYLKKGKTIILLNN